MTTTDTMDTMGTIEQCIRCAGAELVRITAPSKKAENLQLIKDELRKRGYDTPLVADIHFIPTQRDRCRIVERVRINPGNYVDKNSEQIEYTDEGICRGDRPIRERLYRS